MNGKGKKSGKKHYTPRELFTFVLLGIVVLLVLISVVLAIVKGGEKGGSGNGSGDSQTTVSVENAKDRNNSGYAEPGDIEIDISELPD